ncbi:chromosomal replication initiation protein DnaA, partial [Rhodococcus hoagii]|nr:chromosomal replication initiation protein DnaA [Prescottella equi]
MNDDPNALANVWRDVVAELTSDASDSPKLTKAQKAWLALVRPLTYAQGFALLSVPSPLAQEAIERDLREPILRALNRHLGQKVEGLGVRIAAPSEDRGEDSGDAAPADETDRGAALDFADSSYPDGASARRRHLTMSESVAVD